MSKTPEIEPNRKSVIDKVLSELYRAEEMFPWWPSDPLHAIGIVQEEVGEVVKEILENVYKEPGKAKRGIAGVEKEAIQAAAMTLRFLLYIEKYQYRESVKVTK